MRREPFRAPGQGLRATAFGAALLLLAAVAALMPSPAAAATTYPDAVLLVSGYNSSSAFTTPDPSCEGQEGDTWSNPDGPAAALRAAGKAVFTAPVQHGSDPLLAPCAPGGTPTPGAGTAIDSFGDNDTNGAALASFLQFLHESYGVESIQLVAHSDGGNWSRSAFTQDSAYDGLEVRSLTTLGTPYTGSMVADIGTELRNGSCDFSDPAEQDLCQALLLVARQIYGDIGPTAVEQLTHSYLESWNPEQSIGACPVTTIAGTGVDLPLVPFEFYNPSDGLVGEASAQAQEAEALPSLDPIPAPVIPGLKNGGTYPVVHASALSFISPANLLNTKAISDEVTTVVGGTPAGGALCNGSSATPDQLSAQRAGGGRIDASASFRVNRLPSAKGFLGKAGSGDAVLAKPGVRITCKGAVVPLVPLLADERLRVGYPGECGGAVRAKKLDTGRGITGASLPAMVLHSHPRNELHARGKGGRKLKLSVSGPKVRKLRYELRRDGKTAPLKPNRRGVVKLPYGRGSATLTARATTEPGARRAVATIVLGL